jgi:hypothetical protein
MPFELSLESILQDRLKNWSYWEVCFLKGEFGYPSKSTIANFGEGSEISMLVRYSKPPFPLNNLLAQEMSTWINVMGIDHPEYKEAIKIYYLTRYKITELAYQCHVSPRTFKERLHNARIFLKGRLSIDYTYENNNLKPIESAAPK